MADDRPAEEVPDALGRLTRELEDMKTSLAYLRTRRPVGDLEITLRNTAKVGSLLLQGQTVSRITYPDLWKWVSDNALAPSVFGIGDGSTTFVLPDMRGRVPLGAGVLTLNGGVNGNDTYLVGQFGGYTLRKIGLGALPLHNHSGGVTDWSDRPHYHGGGTSFDGDHSGHNADASTAQVGTGRSIAGNSQVTRGNHAHTFTSATENVGHKHGFSTSNAGNDEAFDVRQPYLVVNYLIWT